MRMTLWAMVMVCLMSSQAIATIQFRDGRTYNLVGTIYQDVFVTSSSSGAVTTVNVLSGGSIPKPYRLVAWDDSIVTISGGSVQDLYIDDNSQFTISGGTVGSFLGVYQSSTVTVSGGSVDGYLSAYGSSTVTISGGSVGGPFAYLDANQSSTVTISGGSVAGLRADGISTVIMSGGSVDSLSISDSSQMTMSGGTVDANLRLGNLAELTITGSDFAIDGILVDVGEVITSILGGSTTNEPYRQLTGTLANGDILDNPFQIGDSASIVLTPEPTTLLLLGLGSLVLRRKCRR